MPKIAKIVATNTIFQVIGKAISTSLGVLITILLTRYLGPEGYGQYIFVLVFVTMFGVMGDWGMSIITIREASKNLEKAGELIGNVLVIRVLLSLLAAVLAIIAINLPVATFPEVATYRVLVPIASIYLLATSLKTSFQIIFNVRLKLQNWAISEVASNLVALGLVFSLIMNQAGLSAILWAINIGNFAAAGLAALLAMRLVPIKFSLRTPQTKYLLWESLPMGAILVVFTIYNRIDTIILGIYHGEEAVGIYGAAYKIFDVLVLGAAYFNNSILPIISRLAVEDKAQLRRVFKKSFTILMLMAICVAVANFIFAPLGIAVIGGAKFAAAVTPLRILSLALLVAYFNHLGGFTLIALGKQRWSLGIAALALVVNIVLNLLLIPRFSYNAAAFTTFLTEGLIVIISVFVIAHELKN